MLRHFTASLLVLFAAGAHAAPTANDLRLTITPVVSGLAEPTAAAFLADGDFLILEKSAGKVRRVTNGVPNPTAVLDLAVEGADERGLLGIALHPDFVTHPYVYLFYNPSNDVGDTQTGLSGYNNVVDRFTWHASGNGGAGSLTPNMNILTVHSDVSYHNGGSISFGPDGKLYGVIGDGGHNDLATNGQLQNNATGAPDDTGIVFRLNDDGTNPSDNPFAAIPGMEKVFAYGIRNSFGITWDPEKKYLWETENGEDDYDEVNRIPAGMDGGWADIMGPTAVSPTGDDNLFVAGGSAYSNPEFSWETVVAPTGIAFGGSVLGDFKNDLFVGDYNKGFLYRFTLDGTRKRLSLTGDLSDLVFDDMDEGGSLVLAEGFGGISDLETGPDGALYVVSFGNGDVHKITGETTEPPEQDLALSQVKVPKKISLSQAKPVVLKDLKLTLVNQGLINETIDETEVAGLVSIDWTSLPVPNLLCPAPGTVLAPPELGFPIVLEPGKKLSLSYTVTWNCANDDAASSKTEDHADFEVEVTIDRSVLGGGSDTDLSDDVCPRPASGDDKGCGGKDANGDIGGPIRTDIVVK